MAHWQLQLQYVQPELTWPTGLQLQVQVQLWEVELRSSGDTRVAAKRRDRHGDHEDDPDYRAPRLGRLGAAVDG